MESLVGYAKRDLVVPQAPFDDLTVADIAARRWCAEVNTVLHSEICAIPAERLDADHDVLNALPSLRPTVAERACAVGAAEASGGSGAALCGAVRARTDRSQPAAW
ncbi:hypothetical protein ACI2LC_39370 [Nonomuraea wenchangensis]|uniref:hypothetical protein n=1 Tax=Nonomuraea wenchangensis TaxID=568860 RepID=UPI0033D040C7